MGADQSDDWHATIASALDWWRAAGVDVELQDAPRDWLAAPAATPRISVTEPPAVPQLPATLEAFATWRSGPDAPEAGWGSRIFVAEGPTSAELMVLIDMPEREDELDGHLLSGKVGRLFDRMLAAIGRNRDDIHLASVAVARPLTGRVPAPAVEPLAAITRHYVGLVAPKRLLLLGNGPNRALLATDCATARGGLRPLNQDGPTMALASFPPALLLERPQAKAEAWKDLQWLLETPVR